MYGNTWSWFRLKTDSKQAKIDNLQTMDDKSKSSGSRPDNPQEGKNKITVAKLEVLDWWSSTAKQSGIICSRCSKEHKDKDVPRHQLLYQWKKEWLCTECWDKAHKRSIESADEPVDEPVAKKTKHSSWDWVYFICELIWKQAEWCMHQFTHAPLVLRTCWDKELRQCCESAARVRKNTRDRDITPEWFFEPPTTRIVCAEHSCLILVVKIKRKR